MINLYVDNVDRYRGYLWGRSAVLKRVSVYNRGGIELSKDFSYPFKNSTHLEPSLLVSCTLAVCYFSVRTEIEDLKTFKPQEKVSQLLFNTAKAFLHEEP